MELNKKIILSLIATSLVFSGCSTKYAKPKVVIKRIEISPKNLKKQTYPVIKQNNLGQRAIVNMGVVLKTNITSYKDNNDDLIASHNVFFWAKKPDFITTNTLPSKKMVNEYSGLKINLDKKGLVDLKTAISQETIRKNNNFKNDKKILKFLQKEAIKSKK